VVDVVVVLLVVVEPVTPDVLPVLDVSELPPVPEAPIELLPPVEPVPLAPAVVSDGDEPLLAVPPVVPLVLPVAPAVVDGLVLGVDAVDGVLVVVLEVVLLSLASFLEQAPSDRAAATANTAAAVLVREVFIRETPLGSVRNGKGQRLLPYGEL
jgi:hypothetical protein